MSLTKHIGMVVLALLIALPLSAQTTLSGMVRDESGKALGNVMVRAYNQHKKLKRYTQTNRQGEFRLATTAHDSISSITLHDEAIQAGTGEQLSIHLSVASYRMHFQRKI